MAREPPAAYPVMVSRIAGTTCLIREKKLTGSGTAGRAHEQNVLACRDLGPRTGDLALKETDGPRAGLGSRFSHGCGKRGRNVRE